MSNFDLLMSTMSNFSQACRFLIFPVKTCIFSRFFQMAKMKKRVFRKRKRFYRKKKSKVKKMITRALVARGLNRPDVKHSRTAVENTGVVTTAFNASPDVIIVPSSMAHGALREGQYIGGKITAKYFTYRGMFYNTTAEPITVRMFIVEDMQPSNGALILQSLGTFEGAEILYDSSVYSLYNDTVPRRWKMLRDVTMLIHSQTTTSDRERTNFRGHVNLHNAQVSLTPGTISGNFAISRNYYMFFVAQAIGIQYSLYTDFGFTDV